MKKNTVLLGLIVLSLFQFLSSASLSCGYPGTFKRLRVTEPQGVSQVIQDCPNKKLIETIKSPDEGCFYRAFAGIADIDFLFEDEGCSGTFLMWAVYYSHFLKDLIDLGADVNKPGSNGDTPLIWAAQKGDVVAATMLLDAEAEINYRKTDGRSALDCAFEAGHKDVVHVLVGRGADVAHWINFFMHCVSEGDAEIVKRILDAGATAFINYRGADGKSALDRALEICDDDMVTLLVNYGADVEGTNAFGENAIAVARFFEYKWTDRIIRTAQSVKLAAAAHKDHLKVVVR